MRQISALQFFLAFCICATWAQLVPQLSPRRTGAPFFTTTGSVNQARFQQHVRSFAPAEQQTVTNTKPTFGGSFSSLYDHTTTASPIIIHEPVDFQSQSPYQQQYEDNQKQQQPEPQPTFSTSHPTSAVPQFTTAGLHEKQDPFLTTQHPKGRTFSRSRSQEEEEDLFRRQAESARYSFKSALSDGIMDNVQVREETRDGLKLRGLYSYSDGFYRRTVHYEADEKGYRVTKEETEPVGDGPQFNLEGRANVNSNVGGVDNQYTITKYDVPRLLRPN